LIETLQVKVMTFIMVPEAVPLDFGFSLGLFFSEAMDFSRQLIGGVAFLHCNGIAHLDIKPANLVARSSGQIYIIDFDISVCVDGPDALIDRWCGTPGWMAPEIGDRDGPKRVYSPIRADLWSCGQVLRYLAKQGAVSENPFEALTSQLLNKNPQLRPPLHLMSSVTVEQSLGALHGGLKRKQDAPTPDAKRLAIGI